MASRSSQKIRLVKCPKCLKILQEDEDVPVYQCGGCSTILQAKKRNIAPNSAGETEGAPIKESETNNVSSSSGQDTVLLPASSRRSSDYESVMTHKASMESTEKETNEIQQQECSLDDSEKYERKGNSKLESDVMNNIADSGASSGSLSVDHVVAARESNSSVSPEISPGASPVEKKTENESMESMEKELGAIGLSNGDETNEIQQECSLSDSEKNEREENSRLESDVINNTAGSKSSSGSSSVDHVVAARESNSHQSDYPLNKTSSAYDGSESCSDEREDQLLNENEEWNSLQKLRSSKFERQRYPVNYKEQGASSSSTYSDKRRDMTTTYNEWHHYKSLQLEEPGGILGRQERRHVTQQLRPNMPLYPREVPSYLSHDEFDRYSRAHSLQVLQNNTRGRSEGQVSRFSVDRRNHSYSPQRAMEQREYYQSPRWSHEIVSNHHRELQIRRLKEIQKRLAKRHIRPIAGGAPFVNCYSCSENLQLPVDFLIFKKKHHLLRCGTCSTVLRFSLQSKTHLVPVIITEELPVSRGFPLHKLMGYSTVSQVFKASSQRPPPSV